MRSITELHHHAMALADKGDAARAQSNPALARERFEQAFLLEQQALTLTPPDVQPTYAVLLRSVASLALEAERPGDALKHIKLGLENASTPDLIRAELEEMFDALLGESSVESPEWHDFAAPIDLEVARGKRTPPRALEKVA